MSGQRGRSPPNAAVAVPRCGSFELGTVGDDGIDEAQVDHLLATGGA